MFRLLLLISFFCTTNLTAATLHDQLQTVNACWANYPRAANEPAQEFKSDRKLIQSHLFHVIDLLQRKNFTLQDDPLKISMRSALLNELKQYASAGVFPQNTTIPGRIPVFIDEIGTHCAVGYLMLKSGAGKLAQKVAAGNNYIYIHQISDPDFFAWQARSGFSVDELALIQSYYFSKVPIEESTPVTPRCGSELFSEDSNLVSYPGVSPQKPPLKWQGVCNEKGQLDGRWVQYYRNGVPFVEGWFKNGEKDSIWRIYFNNKSVCEEVNWENGKKTGAYTRYTEPGIIEEKGFFEDDLKTGLWTTWYYNIMRTQGNYLNGKKNGKWLYFHLTNDSPPPAFEELFLNGVMQSRIYLHYQTMKPIVKYSHISDSLYYYQDILPDNSIREEGYIFLMNKLVKDEYQQSYNLNFRNYIHFSCWDFPSGYKWVEKQERTAKWIVRGDIGTRISDYMADSAWIYLQRDSIIGADIFKGQQHILIKCLPGLYRYPGAIILTPLTLTSKTIRENGNLTEQTYYDNSGRIISQASYRDTIFISGSRLDATTQQIIIWHQTPPQSIEPIQMTIKSASGKILCIGNMLDTNTRHGYWEFYDLHGNTYAKGYYFNNLRSGAWEETDTLTGIFMRGNYINNIRDGLWIEIEPISGNTWSGSYSVGKKTGKWELRKPNGSLIKRKNY